MKKLAINFYLLWELIKDWFNEMNNKIVNCGAILEEIANNKNKGE